MADEDYYKILGVSKDASADEIQKAYRKLARKFHPDLHADKEEKDREKAKQQFQKVQQAYDVLSDEKKRQMYDMGPSFGQAGGGNPFGGGAGGNPFGGGAGGIDLSQMFGGGGGGGGGGFEDILRQMGGGGGPMGGRQQAPPRRGSDIEKEITIPFATSVVGGQHQVSLQRTKTKVDKIDVKIPAGIESGKKIRLRGQGQSAGGPAGDLLITVKIAPHPNYARKGLNLQITIPITLREAAEGATIDLPTPHGTVALKVPAGTSSGKSLRLKGMGIKAPSKSGDLIAMLQIAIPKEISASDVEKVSELSEAWEECADRSGLTW